MAKKNSAKQGKDFFDTRNGQVLADLNFAQRSSSANPKTEIGFIREAFPLRSKDDITLVLQSCDYNVEAAIACFTNGEADNILKEWSTQGRKSKNAKKKRNKKKQAKHDEPEIVEVAAIPQHDDGVSQLNPCSNKDETVTTDEDSKKPLLAVTTSLECPSSSPTLQLPHPPSPSSSDVSLPSSSSDHPTDATQDPELPSKHSQGSPSHSSHTPAKLERMTSTGPDALKKTVKDLQRSSVSLPRFQLLLEEECDKSFKSIAETFQELRQCLNDREAHLQAQMEEFKSQAVELLEQRQENAAALKLKSDRVGGMQEAEVTQLRSEIKNFVTERKIDEELARTTRFVGDRDKLKSMIENFGEVVPIKSCYSPVTLNPPPLPTKKAEGSKAGRKAAETVSSGKSSSLSVPVDVSVPVITVANDENSASNHKALQEVVELHAKLQAALQQQGLSSSTGKHPEGQNHSKPDHKKDRPNSASQATHQPQTSGRSQTAHPPSQQYRKEGNQQGERRRPNRSAEPRDSRQDRQNSSQSNRNPKRSNQHRPPQRNSQSETSNQKSEGAKNEGIHSAEVQEHAKLDKDKQPQSSAEKVTSEKSVVVQEKAKSENRTRRLQEPREGGDERRGNRNRRRGGRREAPEGHNMVSERAQGEKGPGEKHVKGPGEKQENGPVEKDHLDKEVKTEVKGKGNHDDKQSTNIGSLMEKNGQKDIAPEPPAVNGQRTNKDSNSAACLNGEKNQVPEKEEGEKQDALPQRASRPPRSRGPQRDRRDGPRPGPAPERHLNGTKSVENGIEECHSKESSKAEIKISKPVENVQNQLECKKENHSEQELEKHLDKTVPPRVNGYIPMKEINEVSIGR